MAKSEWKIALLFYLFGTFNAFLLQPVLPILTNLGLQLLTYGVGMMIAQKVN